MFFRDSDKGNGNAVEGGLEIRSGTRVKVIKMIFRLK